MCSVNVSKSHSSEEFVEKSCIANAELVEWQNPLQKQTLYSLI